jgi:hypothetical protein
MPVLTERISNRVYIQEMLTSFVEGFLRVYIYLQEKQSSFCGEDGSSMLGLSGRISNRMYLQEKQSSFVVRMDHQCQS